MSKQDTIQAERVDDPELEKSRPDYGKVDKELAQYVSDRRVVISPEEDVRLRKLIDKRILAVMITTYFLQAIDKGTMSFASIMGIIEDNDLQQQEVSFFSHLLTPSLYLLYLCLLITGSTNGSQPASTSPSSSSNTPKTG